MKAIIMAGGKGSRLRPLTCNRPKPMMPMMGKPVLQYSIELLRNNGIKDIGITLQYLPDSIMSYFGDGQDFGVNIHYFIEDNPLGTAGSVKNAQEFLDETFVVLSGDAITDVNLINAVNYHWYKKSTATLVLKEVKIPLEYGVVVTDKDNRINGFLEKPNWREAFSDKVNTGIYIFEPEIFKFYNKDENVDFSNDLFPLLLQKEIPMYGYTSDFYWCDIGSIQDFMNCSYDILTGNVNVNIKGEEYSQGVWLGNNCSISPKANIISPVYIGDNSIIYENVEIGPYSIIGKNNIILSGSTIKRSIVFDNSYIGKNVELRASIIGRRAKIGNYVSAFEGSVVGDESSIGERTIIKPKVKIWPSKYVGEGETVTENLIWNDKIKKSFFNNKGIVTGYINSDITPEFLIKLSSAYGSVIGPECRIAISCSENGAASALKYSIAAGLMAMGIEVYDLNRSTLEVTRMITVSMEFKGAIHVFVHKGKSERADIVFIDENGININKNMRKKIENKFIRQDFRRSNINAFKSIVALEDCTNHYIDNIANKVDQDKIENNKYKVVVFTKNSIVKWILINMLKKIKVDFLVMKHMENLQELSEEVKSSKASLGIFIQDDLDNYVLVDEEGKIIKNQLKEVLKALIMLKIFDFKTLVVPVDATYSIEKIAYMNDIKFIRTKMEQKSILDEYLKNERDKNEKYILLAYLSTIDAVSMVSLILNLMAKTNNTLSELIEHVPKYYSKVKEIECPWEMKGKVLRSIIEKNDFGYLDLTEGVRINFPRGWVLVLPDLDKPVCSISAEGEDEEYINNMIDTVTNDIRKVLY